MRFISDTDLILNADGSVYHLNLLPGDIADTIILVGDPERVPQVSRHFDTIDLKKGKREFITHTGVMRGKRLSVVSTGIGTDNIDIVLNELDALVNIDLDTRMVKGELNQLNLIRIGTSGAVQADIPIDSLLVSSAAIGLDSLMHYYKRETSAADEELLAAFSKSLNGSGSVLPYFAAGSRELISILGNGFKQGITITAPGFYAPQGRSVRVASAVPQFFEVINQFEYKGQRITNLEMETAGIYGMAAVLGHRAISFNVILANRATNVFSRTPAETMERFIGEVLDRVVEYT
ncbi:nucleoside phosphorylase [Mucilaginibacter ginkgonis]|uniref:Uridine phosphorylase n=2 Tax=Mucilaginibacter ginkgonis TaxID=2682091 RepID=A0A6I4I1G1_9SPHI|nr:nucleoside phosphorylase [Mucilaginibacter ginkgonis]QQL51563.1 nucleoside phosphorylase [Mucilaginibacter ginkgonis]